MEHTVYLQRATIALRGHGLAVNATLLQYRSPLGWEHINLTGDYLWRNSVKIGALFVQDLPEAARQQWRGRPATRKVPQAQ